MNIPLKIKIIEVFGSQSDFALKQRVNESLVSRVVRGRRSIPDEAKKEWAKTLKCKPEEVFQEI